MTKARILAEVRRICLALPETSERPSHGEPTFFVRQKRSFATVWDSHHCDGRFALICAAPPECKRLSSTRIPSGSSFRPTSGTAAGSASV
jgi:hypothetical protein